jgi:hypothetical protein
LVPWIGFLRLAGKASTRRLRQPGLNVPEEDEKEEINKSHNSMFGLKREGNTEVLRAAPAHREKLILAGILVKGPNGSRCRHVILLRRKRYGGRVREMSGGEKLGPPYVVSYKEEIDARVWVKRRVIWRSSAHLFSQTLSYGYAGKGPL